MPARPSKAPHPRFGEVLRHLRVARGLTQESLAERSGLSARGISDLERGVRTVPYRTTLLRLIDALEATSNEEALLLSFAGQGRGPHRVAIDAEWTFALGSPTAGPETFVGRAAELIAIVRALHDPGTRLLTLTGPPGVGKTRLAIEATQRLAALASIEIAFVDLAPLTSPLLVLPAIATAVGVRETGTEALCNRLQTRLAARPVLLVLDNFEHLLAAAPVVAELLQVNRGMRFLITSREPLGLSGEYVLPVPPLATPELSPVMRTQDVVGNEAVALFVMRARASDPEFQLSDANARAIAELCIRLDGLPLALELAAARVPHLTADAITQRLAERRPVLTAGRPELPARQRTLADAIDWSYDLLRPDEQRLFRLLSVFRGGFSLQAVEAVATALGERNFVNRLTSLDDKSLLVRQPGRGGVRFTLLETIREYGLERLAASGEDAAARQAHAVYFLTFAEEAARDFRVGAGQREALLRLEEEHDNLRQALAWALEQVDPAPLLRLAEALWRFWWIQGHLSEGQRWLARALERGREAPPVTRAKTFVAAGRLAWLRGELALARLQLEQALALGPEPFDRCEALNALGDVARYQGDYARADAVLTEATALGRAQEDWFHLAASLHNLGTVALDRGDHEQARAALEEGLAWAQRGQNHYLAYSALHYLRRVAFEQSDYAQAAARSREELAVQRELVPTSPVGAAGCLEGVALLAVVQNQPAAAARLFGAMATLLERAEDIDRAERKLIDPWVAAAREALGDVAFRRAWEAGRGLPVEAALAEATDLLQAWTWTASCEAPSKSITPV